MANLPVFQRVSSRGAVRTNYVITIAVMTCTAGVLLLAFLVLSRVVKPPQAHPYLMRAMPMQFGPEIHYFNFSQDHASGQWTNVTSCTYAGGVFTGEMPKIGGYSVVISPVMAYRNNAAVTVGDTCTTTLKTRLIASLKDGRTVNGVIFAGGSGEEGGGAIQFAQSSFNFPGVSIGQIAKVMIQTQDPDYKKDVQALNKGEGKRPVPRVTPMPIMMPSPTN